MRHLHSLHQQHGLGVILVSFQDKVCQFVDDDVQRALVLQRLTQVQLQTQKSLFIIETQGQDIITKYILVFHI